MPLKKTASKVKIPKRAAKKAVVVRKAKPVKRRVVAAKSKAVKSTSKKVVTKKTSPRPKAKKAIVKTAVAKNPAKTSAKVAAKKSAVKPKASAKSSGVFAKTNKPVVPLRPRPLSPHLSIYRPQITSMLSILHRGTGVVLYLGAFVLAALIISLGYGEGCFGCLAGALQTTAGSVLLYGFIFCLFYHLCNGIRHLMWDIGEGFDLCTVTLSGLLVLVTSLSLTAAIWFILHPQFLEQFYR